MSFRSLLPFALCLFAGTAVAASGTVHRGLGPEPDSLDIHQAQGLPALQVLRDMYEGLVSFDAAGQLVGGVAQSWVFSDDGLQLNLKLRKDSRWSDGTPVLAQNFVRAWQTALAPATQARTAGLLTPVKNARAVMSGRANPSQLGITAVSDHELNIEFEQVAPWFPEILAHPVSFPKPDDAQKSAPVNGAFRLIESVPQSHIRLEKNPTFHAADEVQIASVVYYPIDDPGSELSRYRGGELHITETIPPGRFEWLQENLGDELRLSPYLGSFWLGFNLRRPPFAGQPGLRRALALAIDRDTLVRVVMGAGEQPAWSVVPSGIPGYSQQPDPASGLTREQRLAQARRLYGQAGYNEEKPLRLELRFNSSTQHRRMAVAVSAMWKQALGVRTDLVQEEWKVFVNNRSQGAITQVFRGGWIADYADPASFLDLFRSDEALNTTFYNNPEFDQLMNRAAGYKGGQRLALLQQAEALLMQDMPVVPLYQYVSRHLVKTQVGGFIDNSRDVHLSRYLYLKDQP